MVHVVRGSRLLTPSTAGRPTWVNVRTLVGVTVVATSYFVGYFTAINKAKTWTVKHFEEKGDRQKITENFRTNRAISDQQPDGWHPVHIFHANQWFDEGNRRSNKKFPKGSQAKQDKIVLALTAELHPKKGSSHYFFLDLAANDAELLSNSLLLEKNGWDGLCIEPNPAYWYYLAHRRCTVAAAFVGEDMMPVNVYLGNGIYEGAFGGVVHEEMDNHQLNADQQTKIEKRYTVSLPSLFRKFQVPPVIDYFSLDVEGAEHLIMKDFPFQDYQINILTVERPKEDLKMLFGKNGLVYVMNLTAWGETLWVHKSTIAAGLTTEKVKKIVHDICQKSCY